MPPGERVSASRRVKGERGIWQRRYGEHTLRDEDDFARHIGYTHFNPVKRGYVWRGALMGFATLNPSCGCCDDNDAEVNAEPKA